MEKSKSLKIAKKFLGKTVEVIIDRPVGSKHPKYGFIYETNYGFIPDTKTPDGEPLDAYFLENNTPLRRAKGKCVAIIHRRADDDDKLVVIPPEYKEITDEQIEEKVKFQEKWFKHKIIRK